MTRSCGCTTNVRQTPYNSFLCSYYLFDSFPFFTRSSALRLTRGTMQYDSLRVLLVNHCLDLGSLVLSSLRHHDMLFRLQMTGPNIDPQCTKRWLRVALRFRRSVAVGRSCWWHVFGVDSFNLVNLICIALIRSLILAFISLFLFRFQVTRHD